MSLLLLFVGFVFLVIGFMNQMRVSVKPVVEYRYVPRTFDEEQKEPPVLTDLFRTMFNTQQPYEYGIGTAPVPKISKSKMYDYNIAQYS